MSKAVPRFKRFNPPLPSIGANNIFLCTMQGIADSEIWIVNLAVMGANTLVPLSEYNIAVSFDSTMHSAIQGVLDSSVTWNSVKVTCLNVPTRTPYVRFVNAGAGWAGTVGATHLPKEMAVVMSKYTVYKGQHGRGRNYYGPIPVTFVTAGANANSLNATGLAAYLTLQVAIDNGTIVDAAVAMNPAIYQRTKGFSPPPVSLGALVTQLVTRTVLGTVRRRRPGRGR